MKRYTKEFLHDEIKSAQECYDRIQDSIFLKQIESLLKIERAAARGLITDFEAIREACRIIDGDK